MAIVARLPKKLFTLSTTFKCHINKFCYFSNLDNQCVLRLKTFTEFWLHVWNVGDYP